jgi:hypothetical protein
MPRYRITWGGGLNADAPPFELSDGVFNSGANVRIKDGIARRITGTGSTYLTFTHTPHWLGELRHATPANGFYLIAASGTEAYVTDYSTATNITRYTEGATISSMTAVGTTVTVTTSTNHGRTTADVISSWGNTPTEYNVEGKSITVTSPTTFTYVADSAPGTSTVVGLYSYNGATSNFTSTGVPLSGGEMGGVFFLNNAATGLYYWAGDTTKRFRKVRGSYRCRVSRPFGNYIFQLYPTIGSTLYPYRIIWSSATEPGAVPDSFDATETNDAGFVDRTEGGELVDALGLGETLIIYKQAGRFAVQNVGGNEIFRFTQLPGSEGLLNQNCVVDTPVGHVFLSSNYQVLMHTGGECVNLSQGRVNSLIIQSTSRRYFVTKNTAQNEVWVHMPNSSTYSKRVLVWNWKEDKWGIRDYGSLQVPFAITTFWEDTRKEQFTVINSSGALALEDQETTTIFGNSFDTTVERTGLDLGEPDRVKNLQRSRWNFDAAAATTATVSHGSAMTADASPTYATGATYTVGTTDYVNSRATGGKYLAIKATWNAAGGVRSTDIDVTPGGVR